MYASDLPTLSPAKSTKIKVVLNSFTYVPIVFLGFSWSFVDQDPYMGEPKDMKVFFVWASVSTLVFLVWQLMSLMTYKQEQIEGRLFSPELLSDFTQQPLALVDKMGYFLVFLGVNLLLVCLGLLLVDPVFLSLFLGVGLLSLCRIIFYVPLDRSLSSEIILVAVAPLSFLAGCLQVVLLVSLYRPISRSNRDPEDNIIGFSLYCLFLLLLSINLVRFLNFLVVLPLTVYLGLIFGNSGNSRVVRSVSLGTSLCLAFICLMAGFRAWLVPNRSLRQSIIHPDG